MSSRLMELSSEDCETGNRSAPSGSSHFQTTAQSWPLYVSPVGKTSEVAR